MSKRFPTFQSHETVGCFYCGGDLDGSYWSQSGYATGRFVQHCEKCRMSTYYDLDEQKVSA